MNNTRNTIQKQVILNAVRELKNHPTSEEVYNYIKPNFPSISLGTVYRNLNLLSETKEIQKLSIIDDAVRFDHITNDHYHYHFQCGKCKKLMDIPMEYQKKLDELVSKEYDVDVFKHDIVFTGTCKNCKDC
ncbi:Fur family transcriptional regulator [Brachyspira hampsonii]|uniref:Fur family transcriptional regulator n=1 Tax=Brachyspira hampsonii TaxID=1287055 RepID=UPI001C66967D|nr:transcriptional repressor [Brachyspira hampsonii]MBW5390459.1 transcriptional repressor [Brachyspira hampsonii]